MRARLRAAWPGARLAAPAYPVVLGPGDNLAIHVAVATAPPGCALAVDAHQEELGFWGEVLTTGAQARRLAGLVIDGCVRDIDALERHRFPVFSTGIALPGAAKVHGGTVAVQATVGGAEVDPGDWLVADADGVVVIPGDRLDEVTAAAAARQEREAAMFERLRQGATTIELLGLDPTQFEQGGAEAGAAALRAPGEAPQAAGTPSAAAAEASGVQATRPARVHGHGDDGGNGAGPMVGVSRADPEHRADRKADGHRHHRPPNQHHHHVPRPP